MLTAVLYGAWEWPLDVWKIARLSTQPEFPPERQLKTFNNMNWLVHSNYRVDFHPDHHVSERVLFPVSELEKEGMEDARFVQFKDDNAEIIYYATYTTL